MWFQLTAIILGLWLMISPSILPATTAGANVDRIVGPFVVWAGVLALRSVTRSFRALHIISAVFLLIAPWLVTNTVPLRWSSVLIGWALIVLAIARGRVSQRVGDGWWAAITPVRTYEMTPRRSD